MDGAFTLQSDSIKFGSQESRCLRLRFPCLLRQSVHVRDRVAYDRAMQLI